ncbi:MAG TPA: amino acid adenylation domain-containing protein [Candidatus Polarisedimenticolia bacterium]|nr:amino acid adenylation domain-containing protein [Candidatus Polarisedimenticolia bacterium]
MIRDHGTGGGTGLELGQGSELELLDALLDEEGVAASGVTTMPRQEERTAPLSPAQRRLWFLHEMDPASHGYTLCGAVRLRGALSVAALESSLAGVVARHESLRTIFVNENGEPRQIVRESSPVDLRRVLAPGGSVIEEATRAAHELLRVPWDLAEGPLMRSALVEISSTEHALVVVMHHLITDGWSIGVLLRDLSTLYDAHVSGRDPVLEDLPVQYVDYAAWLSDRRLESEREDGLSYWKRRLTGAPQRLDLPSLSVSPVSRRGGNHRLQLSAHLSESLKSLGRSQGATLYMTLLAAFEILISRKTGQEDFLIGSPVAGRSRVELQNLIGFFVNTLVLRADLSGDPTFRELLDRVRATTLEAFAHQEVPVERIVEALRPERESSTTPMFQLLFVLQNAGGVDLRLAGLEVEELEIDLPVAKFDLTFDLKEAEGGLAGTIEFDADRFEEETIRRLVEHYGILLQAIVADPDARVSRLPLMTPEEEREILDAWSGRKDLAPSGPLIHERFSRQAAAAPERIAAVLGDRRVTYGEIDSRSGGLAASLLEMGIGEESRVGLCVDRSPEMLVGILAALKAGAAFVPLDPFQPPERLAAMIEDAGVRVVLTTKARTELVESTGCAVVPLEETIDAVPPRRRVSPESLAYVIYTSGTTGAPKGVMVTHASLAAAYAAWDRLYRLEDIGAHLQMAALGFDVCVGDVVRALGSGGTLVFCERDRLLEPARLLDLIQRERVEFGDFVPAIARPLAACARERGVRLDSFRIAVVGSDVWTSAEIEPFRAAFGSDTRLANSYGVTETAIDSTCGFVGDGASLPATPPVGRPLSHTTIYLLDERLRPVPPGVFGEIYLGGPAVARGYLGKPDLTAGRFVPDPFGEPGARLYKTGDRAWYLQDGRIVFAGRSDDQVKIRGQRIEPAEVEAALAVQEEVGACTVVARPDPEGVLRLAAYVVPRGKTFDPERLRQRLAERLPAAMIPSAIVPLEALPLSANGKVDRRKLPEPEWSITTDYEPPAGHVEAAIAAAFQEVLRLKRVGAGDDFFALGGHSLLATQVVSRIRCSLGLEVPLRTIFESPTVRALAMRIASLDSASAPPPLAPASAEERRLPSSSQQRLWFLHRLDSASLAYNLPSTVHLRGTLDAGALQWALTELVRRQEALRTRFVEGPDGPELSLDSPTEFPIDFEDLSRLEEGERREAARRRIDSEARRPFDLARDRLLRATLLKLGEQEHFLQITMHHIVADDWSTAVLIRELGALYGSCVSGRSGELEEIAIQYADWAAWQRRWLAGGEMERQLAWWRRELDGSETLVLSSDRPRSSRPTHAGAPMPIHLPADLRDALERLARQEGATLTMVLLAGYAAVLGRRSGQRDFAVGMPVANRRAVEAEALIGFFVNTLPVRVRLSGNPTFRGLIRRMRESCLGAYANQDVPFERIVEAMQPERTPGANPVVQTLFALQNAPLGEIALPGLDLSYEEPHTGVTRFEVELLLYETAAGLEGALNYSTELFDGDRMRGFADELRRLFEEGLAHPDRALADLLTLDEAQRRRLLHEWNANRVAYGDPLLAHGAFEAHARLAPDATAALFGEDRITYGQLDARANCLARYLRKRGVGCEDLVPVCVKRSFDNLVALLGVMKAGAAYVPLDPEYPPDRIALILEDVGAAVVLTQASLQSRLPQAAGGIIRLDEDWARIAREEDIPPDLQVPSDALVYAVYTSGSTGRPKGVAMSHRAIANLLSFQRRDSQASGGGRTLQFAPLSFDVSFQEIFSTFAAGGCVVLVSEDERRDTPRLLRRIEEQRVERLFLPFVALNQLAETAAEEDLYPESLREIDTAGEQLKITPALRAFFARLPSCRLVNHYGPSETHLVTTFVLEGDPSEWPALPAIGRPIPNAPVYLLDGRGRLIPAGVPGEVCVGGAGLARGYHDRADLTAERFLPDPFSEEPGARYYRTGDLARFRGDGNLEFLGRIDLQVKIRGYRVEPGEIEVALTRHAAVRQAVVTSHEHSAGKRLAAYVVPHVGARITPTELRAHLSGALPEYMVPAALMLLEALPLTPNGKVDRQALPDPDWGAAAAYVVPRTPQEEVVCGLFAEVLGLSRVGATDNFFELGGHSLLATRVLSRVRRAFGVEMPLRTLFESPTPAGIAQAAARSGGAPAPPPIGPASGPRRNLLSYAQRRLWFLHRLEPGSAAYNLPAVVELEGDLDLEALSRAMSEILRRHESLRTRFVEGPEGPEQAIDPPPVLRLEPEPVPSEGDDVRTAARRLLSEEAALPFDLARGPVLRARLLRLGRRSHLLSMVVHHISADGWSMGVLLRELSILYGAFAQGHDTPLADPEIQYADWAAWQRDWLEEGELDRQIAHWRSALQGAPATLDLPADRARPMTASWNGETLHVALPAGLRDRLTRLARSEGVTLQMALLAGYSWTLMRHAGQREIVVGTPVANRRAAEAEGLVGFFVNTLAVRVDGRGDLLTFRGLLTRVRDASLSAYVNQDVPFERVVEELHPERALNRAPLFQTAFALQSPYLPEVDLPGLKMSPFEIDSHTAKFDLMLVLDETEDAFEGGFEYNTDLFERQTIETIFARMRRFLEKALAAPDAPLLALSLREPGERDELDREYSAPLRGAGGDSLLHELFERQAVGTPDAPALSMGEQTLRYAELNERASRLALRLRKLGIGPERRVAILLDRSIESVVALLAVLKAGGAYVPLETGQPEARLRWVIEDCGAALVLTNSRLAERLAGIGAPLVSIDGDQLGASREPASRPALDATSANLAYVIYTSGSTGRPKGVGIEHRQIAGYVTAAIERLEIGSGWRFGLVSTLAADLGNTALFPCLATGGCLHLLPADLSFDAEGAADYFERFPVDCLKIVPSHLQALLGASRPARIMPRRLLVLGGEATPGPLLTKLRELAPECRVANHYGPTEATVGAVAGFPEPADVARPGAPLGRALSNAGVYLLDERLEPVPVGMPGELFVGGDGVARGYLGAAALTADRFVPDPFAARPGERMYRTGDRARRLRDGRLEFLGRADGQLKIRGHRVEPREAEAVLRSHPDVRDAAVIARPDPLGGARLVAYVVPDPRVSPTVQGHKRRRLPNGMAVAELNRNETDYIYREIFELRAYTRHGITLRAGDTVFDVGANIGLFSLFAGLARPQTRILAFEPNPHLQAILRANLSLFAPTASAFEIGLAERERRAAFTFFPGFSLFSGLYADPEVEKQVVKSFLENQGRSGAGEAARLAQEADALLEERFAGVKLEVPLRTLSDLLAEQRIERIHLLKINAEKAELDVLHGIREEDWARIDQAVLELDLGEHLAPIVSLLEDHGFQVHVDQDPLLERTSLRYVYAAREGSGRALVPGAPCSLDLPLVQEPLLSAEALRAHMGRWLPDPLLPSAWAFLESLPLTANGKLDRSRLPEPSSQERPYQAPRGEIERAIAEIWAEALRRERVGAHDNFFDLGGHSLLLARVHARLRENLHTDISIVELFRFPTVASLAARLADGVQESDAAAPDRLRGARRRAAARARTKSRATPAEAKP